MNDISNIAILQEHSCYTTVFGIFANGGVVDKADAIERDRAVLRGIGDFYALKPAGIARRCNLAVTTITRFLNKPVKHQLSNQTYDALRQYCAEYFAQHGDPREADPAPWSPSEGTILELLAAAMLVDEDDHERRDLIQDVANKAQTVLARIAEKPEYEADQSRIAGMFETVRAAAAALPIAPTPTQKRTPDRKADSPANNEK